MLSMYWNMVSQIQNARDVNELRSMCNKLECDLRADSSLSNDDFDELMLAISYLYRNAEDLLSER